MSALTDRIRRRRDHRWAPRHLSEFVDDELSASARARLQRHASECPECAAAILGLRRLIECLHALPGIASAECPDIVSRVGRQLPG